MEWSCQSSSHPSWPLYRKTNCTLEATFTLDTQYFGLVWLLAHVTWSAVSVLVSTVAVLLWQMLQIRVCSSRSWSLRSFRVYWDCLVLSSACWFPAKRMILNDLLANDEHGFQQPWKKSHSHQKWQRPLNINQREKELKLQRWSGRDLHIQFAGIHWVSSSNGNQPPSCSTKSQLWKVSWL